MMQIVNNGTFTITYMYQFYITYQDKDIVYARQTEAKC